jgi:hypothetical protein
LNIYSNSIVIINSQYQQPDAQVGATAFSLAVVPGSAFPFSDHATTGARIQSSLKGMVG